MDTPRTPYMQELMDRAQQARLAAVDPLHPLRSGWTEAIADQLQHDFESRTCEATRLFDDLILCYPSQRKDYVYAAKVIARARPE